MGIDIRYPLGALFALIGLVLIGFGLLSDSTIYQRSLGININAVWGAVMLVGGLFALWLARKSA